MAEPENARSTGTTAGAEYPDTCGVPPDLLKLLVCPMAHADLRLEDGHLVCTRCGPRFTITDGIPIMLIEEAKLPPNVAHIEDLPCYAEVKAREKPAPEEGGAPGAGHGGPGKAG